MNSFLLRRLNLFRSAAYVYLFFSLSFLLFATATLAEKNPVPDGDTMDEFIDSMDQYQDRIERDTEQYYQEIKDKDVEKERENNPLKRGAKGSWLRAQNGIKWMEQDQKDVWELFQYYRECSETQYIGLCARPKLFGLEFMPYFSYRVPFQKIEAHEIPFFTAYHPRNGEPPNIDMMMNEAETVLYDTGDRWIENINGKRGVEESASVMSERLTANKFETETDGNVPQDFYETVRKSGDLKKHRFSVSSRARQFMQYHVVPTHYSEYFRDFPMYNMVEINRWVPDTWCHRGAKHHDDDTSAQKPKVPYWYSEGPQGIILSMFDAVSYKVEKLRNDLFEKTALNNCREQRYEAHTPDDIMPEETKRAIDGKASKDLCLPEMNTRRGGFTNYGDTRYPAQQAQVATYRALKVAWEHGNDILEKQGKTDEEKFHEFLYEDDRSRNIPRDRWQWLHPTDGKRRVPKGCDEFKRQSAFIPDWWGPEYGSGNYNITDKGNWYVAAQWSYQRCCPKGWFLFVGPRPKRMDTQNER